MGKITPLFNRIFLATMIAIGLAWPLRAEQSIVFLGLEFPKSVGGFARKGTHDYETENPGLGYQVRYERGAWWADVYVYNLGQASIPNGPDSAIVKAQYQQASGDILKAAEVGLYRKATPLGTFTMPRSGTARFDCGAFATVQKNGTPLESLLCVTGFNDNFVKFRISAPSGQSSANEVETFINAWAERLFPK